MQQDGPRSATNPHLLTPDARGLATTLTFDWRDKCSMSELVLCEDDFHTGSHVCVSNSMKWNQIMQRFTEVNVLVHVQYSHSIQFIWKWVAANKMFFMDNGEPPVSMDAFSEVGVYHLKRQNQNTDNYVS